MVGTGHIKLYRQISEKGWYKDSECVHLWIHLLLKATYTEREFMMNGKIIKLKPGQFVTGRKSLAEETGINESKVERILNMFKIEQQIEQQTNSRNRLITILSWDNFQKNEQQTNSGRTTDEQRVNTYNKDNKDNKENNINKNGVFLKKEKPIDAAKEFYEKETTENAEGLKIKEYKSLLNYIFKTNPLGVPATDILGLKNQLTYEQFVVLLNKIGERNIHQIYEKIEVMINSPAYLKGKSSLYLTLNSWFNRELKK